MFRASDKSVPFGVGAPFLKDGKWYVTVTIDNASSVERLAKPEEIPTADVASVKHQPVMHKAAPKPAPPHPKKKGR